MIAKDDGRKKFFFTFDEFEQLLKSVNKIYQVIYKTMASSGIRVRELTRLNVDRFNKEDWRITLESKNTKARNERGFFIPPEFRDDFRETTNAFSDNKALPLFHRTFLGLETNSRHR